MLNTLIYVNIPYITRAEVGLNHGCKAAATSRCPIWTKHFWGPWDPLHLGGWSPGSLPNFMTGGKNREIHRNPMFFWSYSQRDFSMMTSWSLWKKWSQRKRRDRRLRGRSQPSAKMMEWVTVGVTIPNWMESHKKCSKRPNRNLLHTVDQETLQVGSHDVSWTKSLLITSLTQFQKKLTSK